MKTQNAQNDAQTRHTLFVGNGVNRLLGKEYEMSAITKDNKETKGKEKTASARADLAGLENSPSFPLFLDAYALDNERERKLRNNICLNLQKLPPKPQDLSYHERLMKLPVENILTTNYDFNLQRAAQPKWRYASHAAATEHKFNLFRRCRAADKTIWHIHGIAEHSQTITIGYEHYVGSLEKMRRYLVAGRVPVRQRGNDEEVVFAAPYVNHNLPATVVQGYHAWTDIFLRDTVHILGFSLDFVEIDVWWALVQKARRRQTVKTGDVRPIGKTIFYDIAHATASADDNHKQRIALLKSFGVEVKTITLKNKDWRSAYDEAISSISERVQRP